MHSNIIEVKKINDSLYLLNENISEEGFITMMLVIGDKRAAIIDTGTGISGDLDKVICSITSKPTICLLTHCDPDHAGGAALFGEIYMSSLDEQLMKASLSYHTRYLMVRGMTKSEDVKRCAKDCMVKESHFEYRDVRDGDVFDLGSRKLEAFSLGGHTEGSMCYIDRAGKCLFSGDSIANANSAVLIFDKCLPLSEYKKNLERLLQTVGQDMDIYTGHAVELIAAGRVSLDHVPCLQPAKELVEGALLSVRGLGRAKLLEVGGISRKGRIFVRIGLYGR